MESRCGGQGQGQSSVSHPGASLFTVLWKQLRLFYLTCVSVSAPPRPPPVHSGGGPTVFSCVDSLCPAEGVREPVKVTHGQHRVLLITQEMTSSLSESDFLFLSEDEAHPETRLQKKAKLVLLLLLLQII